MGVISNTSTDRERGIVKVVSKNTAVRGEHEFTHFWGKGKAQVRVQTETNDFLPRNKKKEN